MNQTDRELEEEIGKACEKISREFKPVNPYAYRLGYLNCNSARKKQIEELRAELEGMRSLQAQTKRDFLKENAELKAELEKTKLEHANTIQRLEAAKSMIILNTRL